MSQPELGQSAFRARVAAATLRQIEADLIEALAAPREQLADRVRLVVLLLGDSANRLDDQAEAMERLEAVKLLNEAQDAGRNERNVDTGNREVDPEGP